MSAKLVVEQAIDQIKIAGDLTVKGSLTSANEVSFTAAGNVLVVGDVLGGVQVQVARILVVKGGVVGEIGKPCRIEVQEDLYISGKVDYAHISARNIYIVEDIRNTSLIATEDIHVESDLIDVDIEAGGLVAFERLIKEHKLQFVQQMGRIDALKRQLERDAAHLHRQCSRVRTGLNLGVGGIVHHEENRIKIDLSMFYRHVEDLGTEEVTVALKEFFAKGIIGLLAKVNRSYIAASQAQGKVFRQLIHNLHELIFLTRELDQLNAGATSAKEAFRSMVDRLSSLDRRVLVNGKIYPETIFRFLPHEVDISGDGEIALEGEIASFTIASGSDSSQRKLMWQNVDGRSQTEVQAADCLHGIVLRLDEGRVVWTPIDDEAEIG